MSSSNVDPLLCQLFLPCRQNFARPAIGDHDFGLQEQGERPREEGDGLERPRLGSLCVAFRCAVSACHFGLQSPLPTSQAQRAQRGEPVCLFRWVCWYVDRRASESPRVFGRAGKQGRRHCQIIERETIARRSPHSVMEVPRAPSTPSQEPLSPPPSQPGESVGSDGADLDSALAVQLASQSSHLTLSASGNDAEGHRAICMRPCAPWTPITRTDALTSLSNSGAQPSPEIAQGGDQEEWQKGATTSSVDALVFNSLPSSRPRVTEAFVGTGFATSDERSTVSTWSVVGQSTARTGLLTDLPNEVLLQILSNLEVCDLLATSRVRLVSLRLLGP